MLPYKQHCTYNYQSGKTILYKGIDADYYQQLLCGYSKETMDCKKKKKTSTNGEDFFLLQSKHLIKLKHNAKMTYCYYLTICKIH